MTKKKPVQQPTPNISGEKLLPHDLGMDSIPFSDLVDARMRLLKAKTGITPNILARIGFCLSLEEPGVPANPFQDEAIGREIKRVTLLGKYDLVYVCLLRTWLEAYAGSKPVSQKEFDDFFVAHMNRGFELVSGRMRSISDLQKLIPAI